MAKLTKAQQVSRLRALLVKACDKHVKAGGKLLTGVFQAGGGCCPIQCAVGDAVDSQYKQALSKKLHFSVSEEDFWEFISGFDNPKLYRDRHQKLTAFRKLGQQLNRKYIDKIED